MGITSWTYVMFGSEDGCEDEKQNKAQVGSSAI
jgi:hypothetical protein